MKSGVAAVVVACVVQASPANGQSITAEASITVGQSTEQAVSAAATQVRAFGDLPSKIHYYLETAWGATTNGEVDAFGAAYPYHNRLQVIEAYAERMFRPAHRLVGVKVGRYRTPFGISSGSDQGYTGFLRPPLMRYDEYFALSNDFLEHGVDVIVGVPRLTVETSVGTPADVGLAVRRSGVDTVVRVQSCNGPLIAGVSYIRTSPYQSPLFATGRTEFTGLDLRWAQSGVQLRGEWLTGRPFDGTTTTGWYADAIIHRVGMGPVTAIARLDYLTYEAPAPFDVHARRQTVGARIRIIETLALQVNLTHQSGRAAQLAPTALDVGVTYSVRRP